MSSEPTESKAYDTYSEAWRHECECRHVANLANNVERARYLDGVARQRGNEAAQRLRRDTWALMKKDGKAA